MVEKKVIVDDFRLKNRRERSSDFTLRSDSDERAVFHMLEIRKVQ
jgi:hypothetical protein